MKNSISITVLFILFAAGSFLSSCQKNESQSEGINSYSNLEKLWADPPSDYRSAPLWDWNDNISKEGISFQMEEFKKAGIGGVFVHPRPGLITEYISDDWHQLFDYTVQKGKELGMNVWIYDENSYPSGFAGGHVPAEMPDSYKHGSGLSLEVQEVLNPAKADSFEVVLKQVESTFEDITQTYENEVGQAGTYYLFKRTYPGKSQWYGGFTYVDLLYPGVTEKFLEITMKGYEKYNRADFGKTLKGIFTDEPNLEAAMSHGSVLRWTLGLWSAFEERWGYNLKTSLPSLVSEVGNWKKVRHDYYELLLELFIDRWAKPNYEYCEANELDWTGHYWEHGWPEPTDGFDEAAFYIWHQQPAVDMLGCNLDPDGLGGQFGNTRAIRELRSAANQAGRKRTLSETYGGGGYEMDFKNFKRLADWQCVFGVNFVNQHLSYYSMKGVRKFDYPPTFSYHEPWWDNYKLMGDYLARISMATAAGEQVNRTLVMQPNTSAWMYFSRMNKNPEIYNIQHDFKYFVNQLEQKHFEYDLGSEKVLREIGSVEKGKIKVGHCEYELLVLPKEMENIDQYTFKLLEEFLQGGGKVLSFRKNIERLDGELSPLVSELQEKFSSQWETVESVDDKKVSALFKTERFSISDISENKELFHQRRILKDGELLLLVNSSETATASADIEANGKSVVQINLFTGEQNLIASEETVDGIKFKTRLLPIESALFFISDKKENFPKMEVQSKEFSKLASTGEMEIKRLSDNVLTIDYLDIETNNSAKKGIHFMKALNELFVENGVEFANPWQHKIQYKKDYLALDTLFNDDSGFEVTYHFHVAENTFPEISEKLKAVVERPELWSVAINGEIVLPTQGEFWIDREFPVFEIGEFVKTGENQITLTASKMSVFAEVMPVYILGDFSLSSTNVDFEITNPKGINTGSWIDSGMPYYSDKVSYEKVFKADEGALYSVRLNDWNGTICDVLVNGEKAGVIAFPPYELDVSSQIEPGDNSIEIIVTGSLKNTFGYFYHPNNKWIHGPHEWNYAPEKQPGLAGMYLQDYGLFEPFDILTVE
ncbi:glycosyl hydrolase [Sunxiuqinia sp. A32]|uniref:glycosyl hydrolase n=1 Tax=Sunxiuqinia sp. A32 TaxID=3461496 RepID=UPI004045D3B7